MSNAPVSDGVALADALVNALGGPDPQLHSRNPVAVSFLVRQENAMGI